ncbi:ATP-dependent DNA helicase [Frankliniella fusca]|uniref:ATP-dependent DNA helicase n=1 Tax=Frankliniella fusca TaxID=407009 RepID=A0AAE1HES2_9NEOP|nr:ATP-dependent DNA helicase [Frankliniella fusca]
MVRAHGQTMAMVVASPWADDGHEGNLISDLILAFGTRGHGTGYDHGHGLSMAYSGHGQSMGYSGHGHALSMAWLWSAHEHNTMAILPMGSGHGRPWAWKKLKKSNIVLTYPKVVKKPNMDDNDDFYKFSVILHVPHKKLSDFDQNFVSWKYLYELHNVAVLKNSSTEMESLVHSYQSQNNIDDDEDIDYSVRDDEGVLSREEWMNVSEMGPEKITDEVDIGQRELDLAHNWHESSKKYTKFGTPEEISTFLSRIKSSNETSQTHRIFQDVEFTDEQKEVLDIVKKQIHKTINPNMALNVPSRILIQGKAGTGKSMLISNITYMLQKELGAESFLLLAPTGVAANNINGSTIHAKLHISPKAEFQPLKGENARKFELQMKDVKILIIDEYSMIGSNLLGDSAIYKARINSPSVGLGKILFQNFEKVIELKQVQRQNDVSFLKLLDSAVHNTKKAKFGTVDDASGLKDIVSLGVGAKIMLTRNLWTEKGLVNGTLGEVIDILYKDDQNAPEDMPYAVICKFDKYKGPFMDSDLESIPIAPVTSSWQAKDGTQCTRTQFPITLAYGITIHKSQGLTLEKVFINIGDKEFSIGLTYVALSRCKTFSGLAIGGFPFRRLQQINGHNDLAERKSFWAKYLSDRHSHFRAEWQRFEDIPVFLPYVFQPGYFLYFQKMGFRDKVKSSEEKPIYVKPDRLPESVAFQVLHATRVPNKSKPGTTSNVLMLLYKHSIQMQFYLDADFQTWTEEDINEFEAELKKGEKWYVVSYGIIGTNYVAKLLHEEKITKFGFPIFDASIHKLNDEEQGPGPSPSKKLKTEKSD